MPTKWPFSPRSFCQLSPMPASTATRAFGLPMTLALYASSCASNSSSEGTETTLPEMPFCLSSGSASTAMATSELAAFVVYESRTKVPMLPLSLFADRGFSGAQGLTFVLYFGLAAIGFYLPMTLIAGWGVTPAEVAIVMLPLGIMLTVLSPFAGKMTDRLGAGPVLTFGSVVVGLAFLGLGLTGHLHSLWF